MHKHKHIWEGALWGGPILAMQGRHDAGRRASRQPAPPVAHGVGGGNGLGGDGLGEGSGDCRWPPPLPLPSLLPIKETARR